MKPILLFALVLLIQSTTLFGQLEKGDWLLSSKNQYSVNVSPLEAFFFDKKKELNLSGAIGYMLSNRLMVGVDFVSEKGFYPGGFSSGDETYKNYTHSIHPFIRYYRNKGKKLIPFVEFKAVKTIAGFDDGNGFKSEEQDLKTLLNLGIHYSIAPNVVLESMIGTKISDNEELNIGTLYSDQFYTNIGFKTILNQKFDHPIDLKKEYLKKGNYSISGSGFFHTVEAYHLGLTLGGNIIYPSPNTGIDFGLSPSITYFKSDNWSVIGELDFEMLKTDVGHRLRGGFLIGTSWYYEWKEQLFFKPGIGVGYSRNVSYVDRQVPGPLPSSSFTEIKRHESIHSIVLPIDLGLAWFIGDRSVLTSGIEFQFEYLESNSLRNPLSLRGEVYSDVEYFLAPNFSLDAHLSFSFNNKRKLGFIDFTPLNLDLDTKFDFSLGFNYFVFRK